MQTHVPVKSITFHIHPDSLLFHIVSTTPGLQLLTHLDRLVLSGLLLFVDSEGVIDLSKDQRLHIMKGLDLSPQGLANVIAKLIVEGIITRQDTRGDYRINELLLSITMVPKQLRDEFIIKLVTNKQ